MGRGVPAQRPQQSDCAGYWGGDHHNGVPIFVPTHRAPAGNPFERVHYATDGIAACVQQAKAAAGDRDVFMHGAYTAQRALKAGVLDAIEIQLRPVPLGQGRRLFASFPLSTSNSSWSARSRRPPPCTCATRWSEDERKRAAEAAFNAAPSCAMSKGGRNLTLRKPAAAHGQCGPR